MGREIKFNFIYGIDGKIKTYFNKTFTFGEIEGNCHWDEISDSPLLKNYAILAKRQYTGLSDKNGVEIYEGDILATENHANLNRVDEWSDTDFGYGVVELSTLDGLQVTNGFWLTWDKDDESVFNIEYVKIIGNIHANPELLEATTCSQ